MASKYVYIREQWTGYYNVCNDGKIIYKNLPLFGRGYANDLAEELAKKENKKTKLVFY